MNILIAAKDAGGAEVLSSWVQSHPLHHYLFVLGQPALRLFERKCGQIINQDIATIETVMSGIDLVLTSTSVPPVIEMSVIVAAKQKQVKTITLLDHWAEYLQRFQYQGQTVLPDEIWVSDDDAYQMAITCFPPHMIYRQDNFYFQDIKKQFQRYFDPTNRYQEHFPQNILYICEPIDDVFIPGQIPSEYYGHTDVDAIRHCLNLLRQSYLLDSIRCVRLRLHPAEAVDKYDALIRETDRLQIETSVRRSLAEDLAWGHWVIGMSSMALMVALYVGKEVFRCFPPHSFYPKLPSQELRDLDDNLRYVEQNLLTTSRSKWI